MNCTVRESLGTNFLDVLPFKTDAPFLILFAETGLKTLQIYLKNQVKMMPVSTLFFSGFTITLSLKTG
jgi:hypothetical protein